MLCIGVGAENAEQGRRWHIRIVGRVADPSICCDRTPPVTLFVTHEIVTRMFTILGATLPSPLLTLVDTLLGVQLSFSWW
jgi:hypothetical protein